VWGLTTTDATRSIMALLLGPALLGSSLLLASPNGLGLPYMLRSRCATIELETGR
jgi:hypothetical protein